MNQFFQEARLRLGDSNVDQGDAEMVKWNVDQGVKRVSVNAAVHNDITTSYIAALLLVFPHPYDFLFVAIEMFENSVPKGISGPQRRDKTGSWKSCIIVYVKGKAVPLQAWSGPEGSRKLRFPDYMTTAQDGGKVVSLTHWPPLPPGELLVLISVRG